MKEGLFDDVTKNIEQTGKFRKGMLKPSRVFEFRPVDVKRIRNMLGVSQSMFAMMIGVSKSTLQNWEQGLREPEGPAKALLQIAEKPPEAIIEALQA